MPDTKRNAPAELAKRLRSSITVEGETYKIDESWYDTVEVMNGYVIFRKAKYGTTSVKIAEEGAK